MIRLFFSTPSETEFFDAAKVLSEVVMERREVVFPDVRDEDLPRTARVSVKHAYRILGHATFLIESALLLTSDGHARGGADWIRSDQMDEEEFCRRFQGIKGVVAQVLAYTPDGEQVQLFERDMPGSVTDRPRGSRGIGFDRVWIPHGFQKTFAELRPYHSALSKRKRLYFDLANHLGLQVTNDLYEAHITVGGDGQATYDVFRKACAELNVKAIHIELPEGSTPSHLITASFHQGPFSRVKGEVENVADDLRARGFNVTRLKMEALLRNSMVPATDDDACGRPRSNYFEFHVKIGLRDPNELDLLRALCLNYGAHLSRNASNTMADGVPLRFATLRVYERGRAYAVEYFGRFLSALRERGYRLSNVLQEYTVYDTNVALDDGWFPPSGPAACDTECSLLRAGSCPFAEGVDYLLPPYGA
jgi:hypothetical protein